MGTNYQAETKGLQYIYDSSINFMLRIEALVFR